MEKLSMKIKRIYHHFSKCEEFKSIMWQSSLGIDKTEKLNKCQIFMSDTDLFSASMKLVLIEWPISCEANFTNSGINQTAWLGQAAAALAIECPEDITKEAWGMLDSEKQLLANNAAKLHIKKWKDDYLEMLYA